MKKIELIKVDHILKSGMDCPLLEPNIKEDCIFLCEGEIIGFFIRQLPEKAAKLAELANKELMSKNVPKSLIKSAPTDGVDEKTGKYKYKNVILQYSTIIGAVPPKPHMKRNYHNISSVHTVKTARNFIKAMFLLEKELEDILFDIMPKQYNIQKQLLSSVNPKFKIGNLFTSSISNYNISAKYHIDTLNFKNTVNFIITKRKDSIGGNLNIPDYNATIDQCDNSFLCYPAWRNLHGVTPIIDTSNNQTGYRNSLVFYPLKAFEKTL